MVLAPRPTNLQPTQNHLLLEGRAHETTRSLDNIQTVTKSENAITYCRMQLKPLLNNTTDARKSITAHYFQYN